MVFGNYGEASRDVHTLIHVAAQRLATKHWRLLGARSQGEVHGFYVAQLRRRMGVTVRVCGPERCPAAAFARASAADRGRALGPLGGRYCGLCRMCAVGRGL